MAAMGPVPEDPEQESRAWSHECLGEAPTLDAATLWIKLIAQRPDDVDEIGILPGRRDTRNPGQTFIPGGGTAAYC